MEQELRTGIKNRDFGIDLVKVISTFAVLALHSQRCSETGELFNPYLYYLARFAMPCFFMCNGFLIMKRDSFEFKYYKKNTEYCKNLANMVMCNSCVIFANRTQFVKNSIIRWHQVWTWS